MRKAIFILMLIAIIGVVQAINTFDYLTLARGNSLYCLVADGCGGGGSGGMNITGSIDMLNYSIYNASDVNASRFCIGDECITEWTIPQSFEENVTVTVADGIGTGTSSTLDYLITQIIVFPPNSDSYNFEANETASLDVIDRDRINHYDEWDIMKQYSLEDSVDVKISNATDGNYIVTIKYVDSVIA